MKSQTDDLKCATDHMTSDKVKQTCRTPLVLAAMLVLGTKQRRIES